MIVVVGANGTVGKRVVARLRSRRIEVRAVTRSQPRPATDGVGWVHADLSQPTSLIPHLDGADAVLLIWPFTSPEATLELAPRVAATLAQHSPRIIYISAAAAARRPESFWAIVERAITETRVPSVFLRPTGFAKNTLMWASQIRSGDVVRWPFGTASRSLIHEDDIASVAVMALMGDGHEHQTHLLSGPQQVTQVDQVQTIGEVLGRPLRWEELPIAAARQQLTNTFGNEAFAESALRDWAGFIDEPEPVTGAVEELTGVRARTYREWVEENASDFR